MRAVRWGLALVVMGIATTAFAQFGTTTTGGPVKSTMTTMPGFMQSVMAKPDLRPALNRPTLPTPFNPGSFRPTLPSFQDIFLMRNVFGPQIQVQPVGPPKKK